jgi:hypothetical protein
MVENKSIDKYKLCTKSRIQEFFDFDAKNLILLDQKKCT